MLTVRNMWGFCVKEMELFGQNLTLPAWFVSHLKFK